MSDSDRQAVIDALQRHTGDGRLTLDEFEERVDEVLEARTRADLDATLRELPSLRGDAPHRPSRGHAPLRAVAAFVLVALLVTGHFWVLIPLAFFIFRAHGRHLHHDSVAPV
ncbi:MAG: DUF1707 domain-containing protein [Acidimicrobiia bacterium]|nr:DUF1707 domain-containing protein [Acidimicrobiia bacterium]